MVKCKCTGIKLLPKNLTWFLKPLIFQTINSGRSCCVNFKNQRCTQLEIRILMIGLNNFFFKSDF